MECDYCGREVSEQETVCPYCGNEIESFEKTRKRTAKRRKKAKRRRALLSIFVTAAIVIIVGTLLPKGCSAAKITEGGDLAAACAYGALYKDEQLTYGAARLQMPGYTLIPRSKTENDVLFSAETDCLFMADYMEKSQAFSFEEITQDDFTKIFQNTVPNVSRVDFKKYTVDGYPVIRFCTQGTTDNDEICMAVLMIMPETVSKGAIYLMLLGGSEAEDYIQGVLDTLEISSDFAPSYEDTGIKGTKRITQK